MSTPHNAAQKGQIAPNVLMAGDPLRAQFTAENYLESPVCFNTVRGMLGYTGTYHGVPVSIMGHGMGIPSIGIYSYELFHFYDVENIIRFGSAGALHPDLHLGDIVIAEGACTDSNYMAQFQLPGTYAPIADWKLLSTAAKLAEERSLKHMVGNVLSPWGYCVWRWRYLPCMPTLPMPASAHWAFCPSVMSSVRTKN